MEYTSHIYILKCTRLLRTSTFQNLKLPFCSNNFEVFLQKSSMLLMSASCAESMNACFNKCEGMHQEKTLTGKSCKYGFSYLQAAT